MASAAEEIAIRLGLKTGDLKAALADAGVEVKKLKKTGEDSNDGFLRSFGKFKEGFEKFKAIIAGGGIIAAFKQLTDAAVKYAENYKGAFDSDVAATLRLKESQQDLSSVVSNFVGNAGTKLIGIMEKAGIVAGALVYGTDAAADALNNLEAESRKAFDDAKAKKLIEAEKELAKVQRDAAIEAATNEGKLNILHGERFKLLSELKAIQAGTVEFVKKQVELEQNSAEIGKVLRDTYKEQADAQKKVTEEEDKRTKQRTENLKKLGELRDQEAEQEREKLSLHERQNALLADEAELERVLSLMEEGTAEHTETTAKLVKVRADIRKTENEAAKANLEIAKLLLIPENERSDVQKEQLKLLTGETTEYQNQMEVMELLNRGVENLTETEKHRLQVLIGQTQEIKNQISEEDRQRKAWDAWSAKSITQKGDVRNLSDTQLDQLIANLNKQLAPIKAADASYFGIGMPIGSYKSIEQLLLQQNLDAAIAEQRARSSFRTTTNAFGSEGAERMFSPDEFNRLSQLFNPDRAKADSQNLSTLATGLQNMFPDKFSGAVRTSG